MDKETEEIKKELVYQNKIRHLVEAAQNRVNCSEIPKKLQKIQASEFKSMLCPNFHKGPNMTPDEITDLIYKSPTKVLKEYPIIAIDGGRNFMKRKRAGAALLYRFILTEKWGLMRDFGESNETFKRFISMETVELTTYFRSKDVLFLSEFYKELLQKSPGAVLSSWDALLEHRYDNELSTIISFTKPLPSNESNSLADQSCGLFMPLIINHDLEKELSILRIRII